MNSSEYAAYHRNRINRQRSEDQLMQQMQIIQLTILNDDSVTTIAIGGTGAPA